mmetsp:Transcript_5085/g.12313  ORF Transcript_5085/g.12313 Transcript_5085/m.12313 type:complete len:190 (+) Transcript_5085:51-620(+)
MGGTRVPRLIPSSPLPHHPLLLILLLASLFTLTLLCPPTASGDGGDEGQRCSGPGPDSDSDYDERGRRILWYKTSLGLWERMDRTKFKVFGRNFPKRYTNQCPMCSRRGADSILLPCTHSVHFQCMPKDNFFNCPSCNASVDGELVVAFKRKKYRKFVVFKPVQWYRTIPLEPEKYPLLFNDDEQEPPK